MVGEGARSVRLCVYIYIRYSGLSTRWCSCAGWQHSPRSRQGRLRGVEAAKGRCIECYCTVTVRSDRAYIHVYRRVRMRAALPSIWLARMTIPRSWEKFSCELPVLSVPAVSVVNGIGELRQLRQRVRVKGINAFSI